MLVIAAGFVVPIVLSPFLVHGLRHLFALFVREAVELFLNTNLTKRESMLLGLSLAKANVTVICILWLAVFGSRWLEWPMLATAAIAIVGVLIALWISIEIVRHGLSVHGWNAVQIGLLSFAGGNLPLIICAATAMAIWR